MKRASVSEAKNQLSALLDRVRHGETVLITDRDLPVARLSPVKTPHETSDRLQELVRNGIVRAGRGGAAPSILDTPPPAPRGKADIVAALLADRDEGK